MKNKTRTAWLLVIGLLFAACSSNPGTEVTEVPGTTPPPPTATSAPILSPTTAPTPTPAATETAAPLLTDSWINYNTYAGPNGPMFLNTHFAVAYPEDWQTSWFGDAEAKVFIMSSGDPVETFRLEYTGPNFYILPDFFFEKPAVADLMNWADEDGLVDPPYETTINGMDAAISTSRNDSGYTISAWIFNGTNGILVIGTTPLEDEAEMRPILEAILDSIVLLEEDSTTSQHPPEPVGLSPEGLEAYDNVAHLLLTEDEINAIYYDEPGLWRFTGDGPGLYLTCRSFTRPEGYIHAKFFSCVSLVTENFDLLSGDIGLYEVNAVLESAYEIEYPNVVNTYFTESGRLGIDRIVQIGRFVYIAGLELVTPLGTSFDDMFGEFEDEMLYEAVTLMVSYAENDPPLVLEFPPGTSSQASNIYMTSLIEPAELGSNWYIGEQDIRYDQDGGCRTLYHEEGPPPVIVNCILTTDYYELADAQSNYAGRDFIDMTQSVSLPYDDPYIVYLDITNSGFPRYALSMDRNGIYYEINLIYPALAEDEDLESSFSAELETLMISVLEANIAAIEE